VRRREWSGDGRRRWEDVEVDGPNERNISTLALKGLGREGKKNC
jgi:hypothetical protein